MKEVGADVGLAFDGDGDRLIAVDEEGQILNGDKILAVCAENMKAEGSLRNDIVVHTVMSNLGLTMALKGMGIKGIAAKVGDRNVLEQMIGNGAVLGGEDSGHLIFLNHHTTGDGIITALQLLSIMKKEESPLSELAKVMKSFPQTTINVNVKEKPPLEGIPELNRVIEEVEGQLKNKGRVLVRYSGTEMLCRVMVEGPTDEVTEKSANRIADIVRRFLQ